MAKRRSRFAFARFNCFGGQARAKKMAEEGYPVKLHIYDLSQGMARELSATIVGKAIEAIWHTGVVVYGREYYFGGGIQHGQPGQTPYGTPLRAEDLGVTHVPREVFEDYLREIGPRYTPATYSLLSHNCNNFSNEAAQFLSGAKVPSYILELPNQVMNSPVGALILPMIQGLETSLQAGAVPQPPQIRPVPAPVATATMARPSVDNVEQGSTAAADKPEEEDGKTASSGSDNGSTSVPPAVEPAAPPVAAAKVSAATAPAAVVETKAVHPDPLAEAKSQVQEDGKTASSGSDNGITAVPPAVEPAALPAAAAQASAVTAPPAAVEAKAVPLDPLAEAKSQVQEDGKMASSDSDNGSMSVPPAVEPAAPPVAAAKVSAAMAPTAVVEAKAVHPDPLAEAKSQVQEDGKTASSGSDNGITAVPPAVEPAALPAAAAQVSAVTAPPAAVEAKAVPLDALAEAKSQLQEDGKTTSSDSDNGSTSVPPAVEPAVPPVAAAKVSAATAPAAVVEAKAVHPDPLAEAKSQVQEDGKTASSGSDNGITAVPPAVEPAALPAAAAQVSAVTAPPAAVEAKAVPLDPLVEAKSQVQEDGKTASSDSDNGSAAVPPAVEPAAPPVTAAQVSAATATVAAVEAKAVPLDPLAEAKSRVQEEVKREFAAIMATGAARPSEAAALATRRVRERYGPQRAADAAQRG